MPFPSSLNPHKHLQCQSAPRRSYLASLQKLSPSWIGCSAFSKKEFKEAERAMGALEGKWGGGGWLAVRVNALAIHVLTLFLFIYRELPTSSYGEISRGGIGIAAIRMGLNGVSDGISQPRLQPRRRLFGNKLRARMQREGEPRTDAFDVWQKHKSPVHPCEN